MGWETRQISVERAKQIRRNDSLAIRASMATRPGAGKPRDHGPALTLRRSRAGGRRLMEE